MKMSFAYKTEEYYQKFIQLQEKLRKSEEERLKLEIKFSEMVEVAREEEQSHYRKLRSKYKKFLEEDRKRQTRNEKILQTLERIETRVATLSAKTERFKILRKQYRSYLQRVSQINTTYYIPSVKPSAFEEKKDEPNYTDLYEHPIIKRALKKDQDNKEKILETYLEHLSAQKCKELLRNEEKSRERLKFTLPKDDLNSNKVDVLNSNLDRELLPNYAISAAEDILNSIYIKNVEDNNKSLVDNIVSNHNDITGEDTSILIDNLTPKEQNKMNILPDNLVVEEVLENSYQLGESLDSKHKQIIGENNEIADGAVTNSDIQHIQDDSKLIEDNVIENDMNSKELIDNSIPSNSPQDVVKSIHDIDDNETCLNVNEGNIENTLMHDNIVEADDIIEEIQVTAENQNEVEVLTKNLERDIIDMAEFVPEETENKVDNSRSIEDGNLEEDNETENIGRIETSPELNQEQIIIAEKSIYNKDTIGETKKDDKEIETFLPENEPSVIEEANIDNLENMKDFENDENHVVTVLSENEPTVIEEKNIDNKNSDKDIEDDDDIDINVISENEPNVIEEINLDTDINKEDAVETGQPINQFEGEAQLLDEKGKPVQQYDENAKPILSSDSSKPDKIIDNDEEVVTSVICKNENDPTLEEIFTTEYNDSDNVETVPQEDKSENPENNLLDEDAENNASGETGNIDQKLIDENNTRQREIINIENVESKSDDKIVEKDSIHIVHDETGKLVEESLKPIDIEQLSGNTEETVKIEQQDGSEVVQELVEEQEELIINTINDKTALESKKPTNVMDMLDTDSESTKQDTKVSNESDFDFSNG